MEPRRLNLKAEVHGEAVTLSSLILSTTILVIFGREFPPAVLLLDWLLCLAVVGGAQLAVRALRESRGNGQLQRRRTLIVGAGDAGEMLVREIERNPRLEFNVLGFVVEAARATV